MRRAALLGRRHDSDRAGTSARRGQHCQCGAVRKASTRAFITLGRRRLWELVSAVGTSNLKGGNLPAKLLLGLDGIGGPVFMLFEEAECSRRCLRRAPPAPRAALHRPAGIYAASKAVGRCMLKAPRIAPWRIRGDDSTPLEMRATRVAMHPVVFRLWRVPHFPVSRRYGIAGSR